MRRGVGYIRVSRVGARAGDSFLSPDLQRDRILQAAALNDVRIVEWFEDLDQSGGKWERPGFQEALEVIERGDAQVMVVARLTRFARSVLDTHKGLARLEEARAQLLAADVNVDTSTSSGRLIRSVLASFAEFELEVARENWQAAKANAVGRGIKIASRAPIGYRFDPDHRLEPDPAIAHLVPELFERRVAGESHRDIVHWWAAQTGVWIAPQTVGDIIRNRSYIGTVTYGELEQPDAHPPLVTRELFEAAQRANPPRPPRGEGTLLAGVLVCGGCGRRMVAQTGARLASGEKRLSYRCQKMSKDGPCPAPASVMRARAEEHVVARFLEWATEPFEGVSRAENELEVLAGALDTAEAELVAYLTSDLMNVVGPDAFRAGAEARQAAVDEAQHALDRLRGGRALDTVRTTAREKWPLLTLQQRRRLLIAAIGRVVVHRSGGRPVAFDERSQVVFRDL